MVLARNKARSAAAHRRAAPRHGDLVWVFATFLLRNVFGHYKALAFGKEIAAPRPVDALCRSLLLISLVGM